MAVAADAVTVAAIPASVVEPAFASSTGARFLAEQGAIARQRVVVSPYSLVDDLIFTEPLVVDITDHIADVARLMTERGLPCAAVRFGDGHFGLVTDALLRRRVLVEGLPATAPAGEAVDDSIPTAVLGDSAAEALILMLDRNAEFLLVTDGAGGLRGIVTPRDFTVSPTTGGVSIHEQVRRASTVAELQERIRRVPSVLDDLLSRQLASSKVITVYSAIVDTIVRRAITLIFQQHPELSIDAFTWLSLGSNGRREATPSSDIDSAVAFDDAIGASEIDRYRVVFGKINRLLADAGLTADGHGATAEQPAFARTNASWRAAAQEWLKAPEKNQGAIMTSLLVDGRPIHGDPGLPAVTEVFQEVRRHRGTMRLLMQESLAKRAKYRSVRDIFTRRETFDIKTHALLPIVNIARWVGLSVGIRGAADHRTAQGGGRFGDAARRAGAQPDRGLRGRPTAAAALPDRAVRARREAVRPAGPRSVVAHRPQHARPGRARDRRRAAPDGQCCGVPARRRLGQARGPLNVLPLPSLAALQPQNQVAGLARCS